MTIQLQAGLLVQDQLEVTLLDQLPVRSERSSLHKEPQVVQAVAGRIAKSRGPARRHEMVRPSDNHFPEKYMAYRSMTAGDTAGTCPGRDKTRAVHVRAAGVPVVGREDVDADSTWPAVAADGDEEGAGTAAAAPVYATCCL